jgi:D-proline reductase (dithiol) PrdB
MADLNEFSWEVRLFLKSYPWRRINPAPWAPLKKPLSECKLALVSSAALVMPEQAPFDPGVRGGDPSFRFIDNDVDVRDLIETHPSHHFDHSGLAQDLNLAFPLDRAHELVEWGRIGSLNYRHLSLLGAITAPGRLIKETAPQAARCLVEDGVDVALLCPV